MKNYQYLIIGGGLTSDAAVRGIRELDSEGSIGMISGEPYQPYTRPSLSDEPFKKGVIYYLNDGRIHGILLWNVWNAVRAARALIGEPGPFRLSNATTRLASKGQDATAIAAAENR